MLPEIVEFASVGILALFWALAPVGGARRRFAEIVGLGVGAAIGEEICLRLYGAYQYAPGWGLWLDRFPCLVGLIWPVVVLSGRSVAKTIRPGALRTLPVWTGLVVWFDASLVEPVATHCGLWSWNLPGPFGVPLIGPVGWGLYAAAAAFLLARLERRPPWELALGVAVGAPLVAHAGILAAWWGGLRWIAAPVSTAAALALGILAGAVALAVALRARRGSRLPWREAIPRATAASLFFGLLAARPEIHLCLFAIGFGPAYLALLPALSPRPAARGP